MSYTTPQSVYTNCRKYAKSRIDFNNFNTFNNVDVDCCYRGFNDFAHYVNMNCVLSDADESGSDMYADNYKLAYVFESREQAEHIADEIKAVFRKNYEGTDDFDKSGILGINISSTDEFEEE